MSVACESISFTLLSAGTEVSNLVVYAGVGSVMWRASE